MAAHAQSLGADAGATATKQASADMRIPELPLSYDGSDESAKRLVTALKLPEWQGAGDRVKLLRFTDGITNTLLKAVVIASRSDGRDESDAADAEADADRYAVLLRAFGRGTDVLIDREREARNHALLMRFGLAPDLLARFHNGLLYRFVRGNPASPADLRRPDVTAAIARRLAEWHARVPCLSDDNVDNADHNDTGCRDADSGAILAAHTHGCQRISNDDPNTKPVPNLWTVMQKWIRALPSTTDAQRSRVATLQTELNRTIQDLGQRPGLGKFGLVFAHCDLLSGNIIILPDKDSRPNSSCSSNNNNISNNSRCTELPADNKNVNVDFIDYEYAVPAPAAFDLANHFAEWAGFDCDYTAIPTRRQRRYFVERYVCAFRRHCSSQSPVSKASTADTEQQQLAPLWWDAIKIANRQNNSSMAAATTHVEKSREEENLQTLPREHSEVNSSLEALGGARGRGAVGETSGTDEEEALVEWLMQETDAFRGTPGLFWGLWALVQATISDIDFDYAAYAERRLDEYWAWRGAAEPGGCPRASDHRDIPLRERCWHTEA